MEDIKIRKVQVTNENVFYLIEQEQMNRVKKRLRHQFKLLYLLDSGLLSMIVIYRPIQLLHSIIILIMKVLHQYEKIKLEPHVRIDLYQIAEEKC